MEYPSSQTTSVPPSTTTGFHDLFCPNGKLSRSSQIALICLNCCCYVLASGGNILVLLAIYKTRSLRKISMYFLASLSSADLLVAFTMNPIYTLIPFVHNYEDDQVPTNFFFILTKIENFLWVQTLTATTFSLCAVTIDRYIAVSFPLRYPELVTNQRCLIAVVFIWVFSFLFSATLFFYTDFDSREVFWLICSILTVGIPFVVILFCNFKMAAVARRQVRQIREMSVVSGPESSRPTRSETASNKKATFTALIVSSIFFLLFFPGMVVFAMLLVAKDQCRAYELNLVWLWAASVSFLHSAFNPWIYCVRGREFRVAIKKMLCNCRK
ncbi:histamine H2 receptor-like [Actinia tenebrosa]|uniref:Histamine H2 receptor-like n=1 Tax=Actinia tenebrosa TaxID=6105 RepID=A0A6P8I4M7_ACTTE|nr:histamine H2 receptor-like [Actinia tenebrosa]XP_031559750.1 histamine H2 receptor-like [Actinia tenebrosa]XP_031559751.1 histamine H2 receptor-like [Actinia tenebrosa]XP_031559752.1 histamine H2 receptor-like [Actinia tenebrosa]